MVSRWADTLAGVSMCRLLLVFRGPLLDINGVASRYTSLLGIASFEVDAVGQSDMREV